MYSQNNPNTPSRAWPIFTSSTDTVTLVLIQLLILYWLKCNREKREVTFLRNVRADFFLSASSSECLSDSVIASLQHKAQTTQWFWPQQILTTIHFLSTMNKWWAYLPHKVLFLIFISYTTNIRSLGSIILHHNNILSANLYMLCNPAVLLVNDERQGNRGEL